MRKSLLVLAVLGSFAAPAAVMAEEAAGAVEPTPDWTFPSSVGMVSDYIFRGQSQSWGKPSLQASIEADHKSGLYLGFSAESVSSSWLPGASVETDFFGGFRNTIGDTGIGYDVGAVYYVYPGGDWRHSPFAGSNKKNSLNTLEGYLALSYKFLQFKTGRTFTEYFGWDTNNSAPASEPSNGGVADFTGDPKAGVTGNTRGSYFYELNAAYEVVPTYTLSGQVGRQIVAESTGLDISYYKAGVTKAFANGWSVGGFYSASSEPDAYKDFYSLANGQHKSDVAKDKLFFSVFKSF